jgi:hypothetical protein
MTDEYNENLSALAHIMETFTLTEQYVRFALDTQ